MAAVAPTDRIEAVRSVAQTELAAHSMAHDRLLAWVETGVFLRLWRAGAERFDELRGID